MDDETKNTREENRDAYKDDSRRRHIWWQIAATLALMAAGVLGITASRLAGDLAALRASTQDQYVKLSAQLARVGDEDRQRLDQRLESISQEAHDSASSAAAKAAADVRKAGATMSAKLAAETKAQQQAQEQVTGELDRLKQANDTTSSKLNQIGADVDGVKGDVDSTRSELRQTGSDLRRMTGDMGVMSGQIATNASELAELRALGDRDYLEFDLRRNTRMQKVGSIQLALAKADPKRNRFTLDVLADDKTTEKKDRTINEPVQMYVSGGRQPYEIVVNQVKKDEVLGYLAVPKVKLASR